MEWEAYEDEDVHTLDNPYCGDPSCWCHTDAIYHDVVEHPVYQDDEIVQAYNFFGLAYEGRAYTW